MKNDIKKKSLISTDWTNAPDGLGGDIQIEEEDMVTTYHLGTCNNEKNRQRKMTSDVKKILLRRLQNPSKKVHLDIIETNVEEKE